ncbi:MAG: rod-binding protein [Pseudohongiellaceae bacterium]
MSNAVANIYTDFSGLKELSAQARTEPNAAAVEVAQQFESIFIELMMKSMREATAKDSLFSSDQMEAYQDIFDKQLAVDMAGSGGLGLAEIIQRQIASTPGFASADVQD